MELHMVRVWGTEEQLRDLNVVAMNRAYMMHGEKFDKVLSGRFELILGELYIDYRIGDEALAKFIKEKAEKAGCRVSWPNV